MHLNFCELTAFIIVRKCKFYVVSCCLKMQQNLDNVLFNNTTLEMKVIEIYELLIFIFLVFLDLFNYKIWFLRVIIVIIIIY